MDYPPHMVWTAIDGTKRLLAKYSNPATSSIDTETRAKDAKGRAISFRTTVRTIDYTPPAEGEKVYGLRSFEQGYGRVYSVRVQMLKNGSPYGASQPGTEFDTESEAWAHGERTVEERRKKYEPA